MNIVKMSFGKDQDGKLAYIRSVNNGLACGCNCIQCDGPLVAKQGEVLEWHFAHAAETGCQGYNPESLLHHRAKYIIADMIKKDGLHSFLPKSLFETEECGSTGGIVLGAPSYLQLKTYPEIDLFGSIIPNKDCRVEVEGPSPCKTYRPDVSVYYVDSEDYEFYSHCKLFTGIEVFVTHGIDLEKLNKIKQAGDISVLVDLSTTPREINTEILIDEISKNTKIIHHGEGFLKEEILRIGEGLARKRLVIPSERISYIKNNSKIESMISDWIGGEGEVDYYESYFSSGYLDVSWSMC